MLTPQDAIKTLLSKGFNQVTIAEEVECAQGTISNIFRGGTPSYTLGLRIIAMANKHAKLRSKPKGKAA